MKSPDIFNPTPIFTSQIPNPVSLKSLAIFIAVLLLIASFGLKAQSITGSIKDPIGKPAEFVTVLLLNAKDSSLAKGAVTDDAGKYEIEGAAAGRYFLSASMIGFSKTDANPFDYKGDFFIAEPITLKKAENELNTVTIKTTKPLLELKADKLVMNIEGSINSTGLNGLELLQKAPGVQIDKDDNVLLKGKSGVKIYIDGRPSPLTGKDLAAFLKGVNSADVEAIEIITNPSAKYDAAGNMGIINIRLKKNRKIGTNGNISLGGNYGITPKYDAALSLNYRDQKINLFGNYSFNQGNWHNDNVFNRIQNNVIFNSLAKNDWRDTSHNFKVGADYFLDSKNTIGFIVNANLSNRSSFAENQTLIGKKYSTSADSGTLTGSNFNPATARNINYNLNYRFADTSGHELNLDVDYGTFRNTGASYQPNYYTFLSPLNLPFNRIYQSSTPTNIDVMTFKADYEQPIFKKSKLGYGFKVSSVKTDNTYDFFDVLKDRVVRDTDRSNYFTYTENVYAAYVNYNTSFGKKWSLQAGLRAEQTASLGNLTSYKHNDVNKVDTTYLNFFPSAALSFQVTTNHSLNLSYSRRINRPSYKDLNPFEDRLDELAYQKGNPFLRPEYTNSLKLTHIYKGALTTSIGYSRTDGAMTQLVQPYDSIRTYQTTKNVGYTESYNLDLSLGMPIKKWWDIYLTLNPYHNYINANFGGDQNISIGVTAVSFYGQNTFKLAKGWSAEVSGWYSSPSIWGTFRNKAQGMASIGVQKKFWNDNASIKVSFDDLFHTANWAGVSDYAGLHFDARGTWEGQQLKINFSYRFGSNEIKQARQRNTGLSDEAKRVKSK